MIVFLAALCVVAPLLILAINPFEESLPLVAEGTGGGGLQDFNVLPRLAATAVFTGGALLWGSVLAARDRWPAGRWPATLWVPVVVFVVVNVLALIFAADWRASLMGESVRYQGMATTLLYVLLFGVTAVAVRTPQDLRWLLRALFVGAVGAAIYALVQKAGLDWIPWTGRSVDRPFGTMGQANVLGAFLVGAGSPLVFLALTAKERRHQIALGLGLVAMLFALFFTVSRSAYVASAVVLLLWGAAVVRWYLPALPERNRQLALKLGVGAAAAAPLVLALVAIFFTGLPQGRIAITSAANSEATDGRLTLWRLGLEMTADRPLLGYGQDAFSIKFPEYRDEPNLPGIGVRSLDPESSHNFFIDLASGTGVLGLLAFLGLVGSVVWHGGRRALATEDEHQRLALIALGGGVLGYLVAVFFGFMEATSGWLFWLLLGAIAGLVAQVAPKDEGENPGAEDNNEDQSSMSRRERRRAERERKKEERQREAAMPEASTLVSGLVAVVLSLLGAIALGWGATITAADLAAAQADRSIGSSAVQLASRAVTLNPLRPSYLFQEAKARERAQQPALAIEAYQTLLRRFEPDAQVMLGIARSRIRLAEQEETPVEEIVPEIKADLDRALELDLFNAALRGAVIELYEGIGESEEAQRIRFKTYLWRSLSD